MPKKSYSKDRQTCQVTFSLPKNVGASQAFLCGDFNDWNVASHPMKPAKGGGFQLSMRLPANETYRYRFVLDGSRWENDWGADGYAPNPYGSEDSVLNL